MEQNPAIQPDLQELQALLEAYPARTKPRHPWMFGIPSAVAILLSMFAGWYGFRTLPQPGKQPRPTHSARPSAELSNEELTALLQSKWFMVEKASAPATGQALHPKERDPAGAWALYHEVAGFWRDPKRYPEALMKLTDAMAEDPYNVEAVNLLGRIYAEQKRNDDAAVYFTRALRIDPKHFGALLGMATLLSDQNKFDEAKTYVDRALAIAPNEPRGLSLKQEIDKGLMRQRERGKTKSSKSN